MNAIYYLGASQQEVGVLVEGFILPELNCRLLLFNAIINEIANTIYF
jgi:hypothetical protein